MTENQVDPNNPGASGGEGDKTPVPASTPTPTAPKLEVKDGVVYADGKKMVAESDLIAAKKSLEGQIQVQQDAHSVAIDTAKLELSAEQQKSAKLNAELVTAKEARATGAISEEELARIKGEAETAKGSLESANQRILELRVNNIVTNSGGAVTAESLAGKTLEQLDSFEEAMKAIIAAKGSTPGNYALGGGLGGAQPLSDYDRRKAALEGAKVGTRNAAQQ